MRLRVGCRQRGPSCGARKDGALLAAGVHAQREDRAANAQRGISKTRSYSLRITPFGEVMRLTSRGGEGASGVKSRFFTGHRNQKSLRKFERCWVAIYRSALMCDCGRDAPR
jgi:hypothetical protein